MPRSARVVIANQPHHIIPRGHNRQVVFAQVEDYVYYSDTLAEWKEKLGCKIYAYCLMTNHVHLVINPGKDSENLALLMKRLAGRYTRYFNEKEKRIGTVWEGRYKWVKAVSDKINWVSEKQKLLTRYSSLFQ